MNATTYPQPHQPRMGPPDRRLRSTTRVVVVTVALTIVALLALFVVAGSILIAAGSGTRDSSGPFDRGTEPAVVDPGAEVDTALSVVADFASAWSSADWSALAALSDPSVVDEARAWHVEGLRVEIVDVAAGTGSFLVTDPGAGPGLIFRFGLDATTDPIRVSTLEFGGDAG